MTEENNFIEDNDVQKFKKKKIINNKKTESNFDDFLDEENILFYSVKNTFKNDESIKIYFNSILFNIFDSDIVLKVLIKKKKNKKSEFLNYIEEFSDLNIGLQVTKEREEKEEKEEKEEREEKKGDDDKVEKRNRMANENENYFLLNIEIDGLENKPEKKAKFYHLRDEYLKSQGVYIVRVNYSDLKKSFEGELSRWLVKMVTHYTEKHQML